MKKKERERMISTDNGGDRGFLGRIRDQFIINNSGGDKGRGWLR
jgi:hypothetical protein